MESGGWKGGKTALLDALTVSEFAEVPRGEQRSAIGSMEVAYNCQGRGLVPVKNLARYICNKCQARPGDGRSKVMAESRDQTPLSDICTRALAPSLAATVKYSDLTAFVFHVCRLFVFFLHNRLKCHAFAMLVRPFALPCHTHDVSVVESRSRKSVLLVQWHGSQWMQTLTLMPS